MRPDFKTKIIGFVISFVFLITNNICAVENSRSYFKNKKVDYQKLNNQSEQRLDKKRTVFENQDEDAHEHKKEAQAILSSHFQDLSQIYIPSEFGSIVDVYQAPNTEDNGSQIIVHIQDLHTNPEAEFNLANILEYLLKNYKMGVVCSEGADGAVNTLSISSFPDYDVREKAARLFVNSGELTGEEYLSVTKYPDMPIWGIEDSNIYFRNIIEFNKIMKFTPHAQIFISQAKKALDGLKEKLYSKEILRLDSKEIDYENKKIETADFLKYLNGYIKKFNIAVSKYNNITLLIESEELLSNLDNTKVMQEAQNLILNLHASFLKDNRQKDMDSLKVNTKLFEDKKLSTFSFYSLLKALAAEHIPDKVSNYTAFNGFMEYLTKANSLDSTNLFKEVEDLIYEVKILLAMNEKEKALTDALRNIRFLQGFFNLKVSNEELDYYLANKESHKVNWFKTVITNLTGSTTSTNYIDYNPVLIDDHLKELEDFYHTVRQRDIAMAANTLSQVKARAVKSTALIAGGFHTKGITRVLREKGYSYIVVSPHSSTDMDEENYHFLLSGKRKPLSELISHITNTLRITLALNHVLIDEYNEKVAPQLAIIFAEDPSQAAGLTKQFEMRPIEERVNPVLMLIELIKAAKTLHTGKTEQDMKTIAVKLREVLGEKWQWPLEPFFNGSKYDVKFHIDTDGKGILVFRYEWHGEETFTAIYEEDGKVLEGKEAQILFNQAKYSICTLKPKEAMDKVNPLVVEEVVGIVDKLKDAHTRGVGGMLINSAI